MLALTRKFGESFSIGDDMRLSLGAYNGKSAKIAIVKYNQLAIKEVPYERYQQLDDNIIFFIKQHKGQVRFYFDAPKAIKIVRCELITRGKKAKPNKPLIVTEGDYYAIN